MRGWAFHEAEPLLPSLSQQRPSAPKAFKDTGHIWEGLHKLSMSVDDWLSFSTILTAEFCNQQSQWICQRRRRNYKNISSLSPLISGVKKLFLLFWQKQSVVVACFYKARIKWVVTSELQGKSCLFLATEITHARTNAGSSCHHSWTVSGCYIDLSWSFNLLIAKIKLPEWVWNTGGEQNHECLIHTSGKSFW